MHKPFFLTFSVLLCWSFSFAKPVDINRSESVARNYWYDKVSRVRSIDINQVNPHLVYSDVQLGDTLFRIFNIDFNGFIIVSGNDITMPVLGFSYENEYNPENVPPSLISLFDSYRNQIRFAMNNMLEPAEEVTQEWNNYSCLIFKNLTTYDTPNIPMLMTNWDQDYPYNELCPEDAAGPGGFALVGCVAVSVAQVMKYYNFPATGTGTHSDNWSGYGNLSVNFGNTTYEWYDMPNKINTSNYAVSQLLYHVGVASNMHYGTDGSGADLGDAIDGLVDHFRYSSSIQYIHHNNYSDSQWSAILKNEIDNARPVIYEGYDNAGGGHAWNCDGYIGNMFHMNWGWGGTANGFFTLDHLAAGGYYFSDGQGMVINIYPEADYPEYCSATKYITGLEGTFDDGSGPEKYQNDISCMWHIQPSCGSFTELNFDYFDVKAGDTVYIYDGPTIYHSLMAKFSENDSLYTVVSTGNTVLVKFKTDGNSNSNGWNASYCTKFCSGTKIITQPEGNISDGSGSCNYKGATYCKWSIQPPGASSVTINFTEFDLANDMDNVRIYKNEALDANQIAKFDDDNPPAEVTVPSGIAVLRFFTNSTNNAGGWSANYSAEINGIKITENDNGIKMKIYPNPANDDISVDIEAQSSEERLIQIFNITGYQICELKIPADNTARNHIIIITKDYPAGLYYVRLSIGQYFKTGKLVVL
jgi:hypothetical protein